MLFRSAGAKLDITGYLKDNNAPAKPKYKYVSDNKKIVTVTAKGIATPKYNKKDGDEATVTLMRKDGKLWIDIASVKVHVNLPVLKAPDTTMKVDDSIPVESLLGEGNVYTPTDWAVSNKNVASLVKDETTGAQTVKLLKKGSVTVTAIYGTGKNVKKYTVKLKISK